MDNMRKLQGIAVSPGICIGEAMVLGNEGFKIPSRFVRYEAIDMEIARLQTAILEACQEIAANRDSVTGELGQKYGDIFEAHLQILNDQKLQSEFKELIRTKAYVSEYAISVTLRRYADVFRRLKNAYLAERINDIYDLEKRLLRKLLGQAREGLHSLTSPVVILASNLTPGETSNLNKDYVLGFATEIGGPSSHTAIVAQALELPAVVGTGHFLTEVSGGETVIIDGDSGLVILRPDEDTLQLYREKLEQAKITASHLETLNTLPAETLDGVRVELMGNIEFPNEVSQCLARGAAGIGLYRTEFIYLLGSSRQNMPSEEDHFNAYKTVIEAMQGNPVTIRTFDLGADKIPQLPNPTDERNPALGLRSIRLSLKNTELFRVQLRAVLRASHYGKVRIMFPLISSLIEYRKAKVILNDVKEELEDRGIPFDKTMQVGMMVEVPAAVIMIEDFAKEVDFFSIGTNDLIQYTLAVDRGNRDVVELYHSEDPAVLKLIRRTITESNKAKVPVSVCGQMSSSPLYTMLLLGFGLRQFSVTPHIIPEIKQVIRSVNITKCEEIANKCMEMESWWEIKRHLRAMYNEIVKGIKPY